MENFFYNSIHILFEFYSQHDYFLFLCAALSVLVANSLLFVKRHMGISLRDKKATQLRALLSAHKLNNGCSVTSH